MVLAVWWAKRFGMQEQHLLLLYSGSNTVGIAKAEVPLYWKMGSEGRPLVFVEAIDLNWFPTLLKIDPNRVAQYQSDCEVLYYDKQLLSRDILDRFQIITEPPGLMKGWYVSEEEYRSSRGNIQELLSRHAHVRPEFGFVKTYESPDFENCRGILHVESSQRWLPLSPEGIQIYNYYTDRQRGAQVYFLFEGGSIYEVLKYETKTDPDYVTKFRLLEEPRDDRYPEVYLRAMHSPSQPTA